MSEKWSHPVFATPEEFEERLRDVLANEAEENVTESWWWLSFVVGDKFVGVAIVQGFGMLSAVQKTHDLGINPGGEVYGEELSEGIDPVWCNRLLDYDDLRRLEK